MRIVKKPAKKAKRTSKAVVKKAKPRVGKAAQSVGGVAARDLPDLPPEAAALARKYGSFW